MGQFEILAVWVALSIIAAIGLSVFAAKGRNAVWGAATVGAIGGLIASAVYYFRGDGFSWLIAGKWIVVAVLLSLPIELTSGFLNRRSN